MFIRITECGLNRALLVASFAQISSIIATRVFICRLRSHISRSAGHTPIIFRIVYCFVHFRYYFMIHASRTKRGMMYAMVIKDSCKLEIVSTVFLEHVFEQSVSAITRVDDRDIKSKTHERMTKEAISRSIERKL